MTSRIRQKPCRRSFLSCIPVRSICCTQSPPQTPRSSVTSSTRLVLPDTPSAITKNNICSFYAKRTAAHFTMRTVRFFASYRLFCQSKMKLQMDLILLCIHIIIGGLSQEILYQLVHSIILMHTHQLFSLKD